MTLWWRIGIATGFNYIVQVCISSSSLSPSHPIFSSNTSSVTIFPRTTRDHISPKYISPNPQSTFPVKSQARSHGITLTNSKHISHTQTCHAPFDKAGISRHDQRLAGQAMSSHLCNTPHTSQRGFFFLPACMPYRLLRQSSLIKHFLHLHPLIVCRHGTNMPRSKGILHISFFSLVFWSLSCEIWLAELKNCWGCYVLWPYFCV